MLPLFSDQFPIILSLLLTSQYSTDPHFFSLQHLLGNCSFLPCLKNNMKEQTYMRYNLIRFVRFTCDI